MSYTLTEFQATALHAAGRSSVDTGNSTLIMVNQAISEVTNAHPWSWRHKTTSLNFVASQNYVALPADFSELRQVQGGAAQRIRLRATSINEILKMRQYNTVVSSVLSYFYAVNAVAQASAAANSTYQLELYPTPSANLASALSLWYLRVIPDLAISTDKVDAPAQYQSLFMDMVRGYAELYELNAPGPNWQIAHARLEQFKLRDAVVQPNAGRLRGTVEEMATGDGWLDDPNRFYSDDPVTI